MTPKKQEVIEEEKEGAGQRETSPIKNNQYQQIETIKFGEFSGKSLKNTR